MRTAVGEVRWDGARRERVRVLVVDDNAVVRTGLVSLLAAMESIDVVGEALDGRQAIRMAAELSPDVVLLDARMPVLDGVSAAATISRHAAVLMLTYAESDDIVTAAIHAGASGYLVHGRFEPEELTRGIHEVAQGRSVLSPTVAPAVFALIRTNGWSSSLASQPLLTAREQEVMNLLSQGYANAAMARVLFISEKTVKNHINHIYAKLGVRSRAEAMARWLGTAD